MSLSYLKAGVDIAAGDDLVERIKPFAKKTLNPHVLAGIGGFGALFELGKNYQNPVLVSGTDGVGTKLKLAFLFNQHETIGQDLVAMSVNDILVQGAKPLFFLDYFACGHLNVEVAEKVIQGIAKACALAQCALIGGETAEMPGMYLENEYDLAGFAVGVAEKEHLITGESIKEGDIVLGLASSGAHSNGYSLIRRIIEKSAPDFNSVFDQNKTLKEILLSPTRIYVPSVLSLLEKIKVKGMAHITGGGLLENIPRILNPHLCAHLHQKEWQRPKLFDWLEKEGEIEAEEMARTFNCGIGFVLIVDEKDVRLAKTHLENQGEAVFVVGNIQKRKESEAQTKIHF